VPEPIYGILPDHEIRRSIAIEPFSEGTHRPGVISYGLSSYGLDIRIGRHFKVFSRYGNPGRVIDPKNFDAELVYDLVADVCEVPPNSYVLGESIEWIRMPRDVTAIAVGKSTYARCGLIANVTPIEAGWHGKITLEFSNSTPRPVKLYANEGAVQLVFFRSSSPCEVDYDQKKGKYQDQKGLTLAVVP
jgi:dCTP deaminase